MEKLFNMTEKDLSLYNLILKTIEKSLKQVKAAELLGVGDRHFRRLLKKGQIKNKKEILLAGLPPMGRRIA